MLLSLIFCFLCAFSSTVFAVESEHYKINVGQGECSTTIVKIPVTGDCINVAVTADIGSSSLQSDLKYSEKYNYDDFKKIFSKRSKISPINEDVFFTPSKKARIRKRSRSLNTTDTSSEEERISGSSVSTPEVRVSHGGGSILKDSFTFLLDLLKNVKVWIVFLSHSDKDHINKLKNIYEKIEGEKPKLLLIVGGEWFNSNSTEDIREILSFIQTTKCFYFFPYEEARSSLSDVFSMIDNNQPSIIKDDPATFNPKKLVNSQDLENFMGTLLHCFALLEKEGKIKEKIGADLYELIKTHVFDKIYIWSLDYRVGNCNAQSLVWSHKLDDLGMTFVYTGDAEQETFKKIERNIPRENLDEKQSFVSQQLRGNLQDYIVVLQGMHHGSRENIPPFLSVSQKQKGEQQEKVCAIDLFRPDACVFSAGNGSSFAHPAIETVSRFRDEMNLSTLFWERYNLSSNSSFVAFSTKSDGKEGVARKISVRKNDIVILCTNLQGTIKFSKEGISVPYSDVQDGYFIHDGNHAFFSDQQIINVDTVSVNLLTQNNRPNVSLEYKEFYDFFKQIDNLKRKSEGVYTIHKINGLQDEKYKLKMIERNQKKYFYIMEKLDETAIDQPE